MRRVYAWILVVGLPAVAFAQEGEHAGPKSLPEQLGIDGMALLAQAIGFLLLVWLLNKFLFTPIRGLLADRQRDIKDTYDKIDADKAEMQRMKDDYERRLAEIEAEGRERIQTAIKEAQAMRDQIIAEARDQAEHIRTSTTSEIERERRRVLIELRTQVADLAINAAEKLIGKNLDDAQNRKLVEEFIDRVEVNA